MNGLLISLQLRLQRNAVAVTVFVVVMRMHIHFSIWHKSMLTENLFCTQILLPVALSTVIISKVLSSHGFKCACVVDVPQLKKSNSRVKQEASLLIWASWLISLVLICRRRLGVIPSLVFSLPLWMVQVTKGLPHTVAGAVWSLHAETQGGVSANLL